MKRKSAATGPRDTSAYLNLKVSFIFLFHVINYIACFSSKTNPNTARRVVLAWPWCPDMYMFVGLSFVVSEP